MTPDSFLLGSPISHHWVTVPWDPVDSATFILVPYLSKTIATWEVSLPGLRLLPATFLFEVLVKKAKSPGYMLLISTWLPICHNWEDAAPFKSIPSYLYTLFTNPEQSENPFYNLLALLYFSPNKGFIASINLLYKLVELWDYTV